MSADIREKIIKLIAHEQSAKQIGSYDEAAAYTAGIKRLLRRHKLTRKALTQPRDVMAENDLSGNWICSCGFTAEISIVGTGFNPTFITEMLRPHLAPKHSLTNAPLSA